MGPSAAKRRVIVYVILIGCGLAVCGWQAEEHVRFRHSEEQRLINRGRDITSTLGVVIRSQRRFGSFVSKERVQSALQDLVRPDELESIAILAATGETIASAGKPTEVTVEDLLETSGTYWHDRTLTLMNVMDLGANTGEDGTQGKDFIKTDASITHGNSGGPVIDDQGKLVGVAAAFRTRMTANGGIIETSQVGLVRPIGSASNLLAYAIAGWTPRSAPAPTCWASATAPAISIF